MEGLHAVVAKLAAVSAKNIPSLVLLAPADNRQSTTFKLEKLKFRSAVYEKQSTALLPQPAPPSSPTYRT